MLYDQLIAEGFDPRKTISLIYRAGLISGRNSMICEKNEKYRHRLKLANAALVAAGIPLPDYQQQK
jgi:hypothetical protein